MKLETTAANLNSALKCVAPVIERRLKTPVLSAVKVGKGRITATNLDMEAAVSLPTIGKGKGESAIDCRSMAALVPHIPGDETIDLSEDDGLAVIGFNGSEYRLPSYPASDFPDFKSITGNGSRTGNAGFVDAMRRVRFAISTEETRYYLNGVAFLNKDGTNYIAATDGHRLALAPVPFLPDGAERQILPHFAVDYLLRRKSEPKMAVFDPNALAVRFDYEGLTLKSKLIDGTYPDVFRVIPTDAVDHFSVDRQAMLTVLRRINAVSTDRYRGVKISGSADGLVLSINHAMHKVRETLPAAIVAEESFETAYNVRYLIDALMALRGDTVTFAAPKEQIGSAPTKLKGEDDDLLVVNMPMRV